MQVLLTYSPGKVLAFSHIQFFSYNDITIVILKLD